MAKGKNQKLKLLYLRDYFLKYTDEQNGKTVKEIIDFLNENEISAERKSIYDDIDKLNAYYPESPICKIKKNKETRYFVKEREFKLAELKLTVDAISSSKFITENETYHLIDKIKRYASEADAKKLQRQIHVVGRVKSDNELVFEAVDKIHEAIANDKKIKYHYFHWNVNKEKALGRNGEYYIVSPRTLCWDDENYYLIAFDDKYKKNPDKAIRHYRVEKMMDVELIDEAREGKEAFEKFDITSHLKKSFGMFSGVEKQVTLEMKNELAGVIIDRFGKNKDLVKVDDSHFQVVVDVYVSEQFFGWVLGLGDGVKIVKPKEVVDMMKDKINNLQSMYNDED